jgi:hypothetical protein
MAELSVVFGGGDMGVNAGSSANSFQQGGMNTQGGGGGGYTHPSQSLNPATQNGGLPPANPAQQPTQQQGGEDEETSRLMQALSKQKQKKKLKEELENYKKESIIDSYIKRRKDMVKIMMLGFLILLGLSINDFIKVYMNKYIMSNELSYKSEMYMRLAVPLTVFFMIWTIKAFSGNSASPGM